MFNLRKYAIDFSQKLKPEQIPGSTIEQKVQWITNYMRSQNIEMSVEQAYAMLGHKKLENEAAFLEPYRVNIQKLREFAGDIFSAKAKIGRAHV